MPNVFENDSSSIREAAPPEEPEPELFSEEPEPCQIDLYMRKVIVLQAFTVLPCTGQLHSFVASWTVQMELLFGMRLIQQKYRD